MKAELGDVCLFYSWKANGVFTIGLWRNKNKYMGKCIHIESGVEAEAFSPECGTVLPEPDRKIAFCWNHLSASKTEGWLFFFLRKFPFSLNEIIITISFFTIYQEPFIIIGQSSFKNLNL